MGTPFFQRSGWYRRQIWIYANAVAFLICFSFKTIFYRYGQGKREVSQRAISVLI